MQNGFTEDRSYFKNRSRVSAASLDSVVERWAESHCYHASENLILRVRPEFMSSLLAGGPQDLWDI